jgi:hypothetical protein
MPMTSIELIYVPPNPDLYFGRYQESRLGSTINARYYKYALQEPFGRLKKL